VSKVPPTALQGGYTVEGLAYRVAVLEAIMNGELDFGYPDDGAGAQQLLNIRGAWVSVSLTNANQLGAGVGAPVTFTHNLNLPIQTIATGQLPNVSWPVVRFVHGDRTGANAAPAAAANQAHSSLYFRVGDTVTANAIQLRVHSGLTLGATTPLNINVFFHPAVQ